MKSWILDQWIRVRASYWFVPSVMSVGATVLAVVAVRWDAQVGEAWLRDLQWLYTSQPAGARALLSTVAGSMITVAGVTFSMTLLAVSHASAQIGPRLMSGFMRDRGNQWTLGTFIATFLYCLMVLRTVQTGGDGDSGVSVFVPHIAILVAMAMAVLSVGVLIYFIHHVPQTINVSNVVARVGDELVAAIQSMYPERLGSEGEQPTPASALPIDFAEQSQLLRVADRCGYLRVLDADGLMAATTEHDLVVELLLRPGDFAVVGQELMRVYPGERVDKQLERKMHGMFSWGSERTRKQDVFFPAEQLVEVLGKAMSPGINGQYTAILCLNQFERALAELLQRDLPDAERYDDEGHLRVVARPVTHRELVLEIMIALRQFVRGDYLVTRHLLASIERLQAMPALVTARPLLAEAAALILEDVANSDMADAEKRAF